LYSDTLDYALPLLYAFCTMLAQRVVEAVRSGATGFSWLPGSAISPDPANLALIIIVVSQFSGASFYTPSGRALIPQPAERR